MATGCGHLFGGRQCGMTLIEQIMVLVIVTVLTGLAVPPMHHLLSRNQVRVAQTDFIAALQHARETAVVSGRQTLFCPTLDGESCSNDRIRCAAKRSSPIRRARPGLRRARAAARPTAKNFSYYP